MRQNYDAILHNDNYNEENISSELVGINWCDVDDKWFIKPDYPNGNEYIQYPNEMHNVCLFTECKLITFFSVKSLDKMFFDEVFNFNLQLPSV